jgi:hypothetical protein
MDSTSTYYAVGLISLIVATLLFIMYINVINMDLATDEKADDRQAQEDSSVQYITMDRKKNGRYQTDRRDYDWDYDERHANETAAPKNDDNLLGKNGHGQRKDVNKVTNWHPYGEGAHPGGAKSAEGFLPAANDLTVKHKLQTGAENIKNTL